MHHSLLAPSSHPKNICGGEGRLGCDLETEITRTLPPGARRRGGATSAPGAAAARGRAGARVAAAAPGLPPLEEPVVALSLSSRGEWGEEARQEPPAAAAGEPCLASLPVECPVEIAASQAPGVLPGCPPQPFTLFCACS